MAVGETNWDRTSTNHIKYWNKQNEGISSLLFSWNIILDLNIQWKYHYVIKLYKWLCQDPYMIINHYKEPTTVNITF